MTAATGHPHYRILVGDMYARWTLDAIVDTVRAIALDYIARPDFYREPVPDRIVDLSSSYGYARNLPDRHQRSRLCAPILGVSDGYRLPKGVTSVSDKFHQYRAPLFDAAIAYTERSISDSRGGLREAVIKALTLFAAMLQTFDGHSARSSHRQILAVTDLAYEILRSSTVSSVFGVMPAPAASWPLEADDQRGAQLVAAISTSLAVTDIGMSQDTFTRLRTLAQSGREAIEAVLQEDHAAEEHFERLTEKLYIWAKTYTGYAEAG